MASENKTVALALSGGGVRAMAFHAGALKYYAGQSYLEIVSNISSVSGGSLLVGMIYKNNNYAWPTSDEYNSTIYQKIRAELCAKDLQRSALFSLVNPLNWMYIFSRANLLSKVIKEHWGISKDLCDIGKYPIWSINGTTAENGKRFRFKHDTCGDYSVGYSELSGFCLSQALAVSAAFPGGIGPLKIDTSKFVWKKRKNWNDTEGSESEITPPYKSLHIYDGGVYDNLGTEPLFDPGRGTLKQENTALIVSDAGSPFQNGFSLGHLNPFRLKRILDICMEQARSLRVRSLMKYLSANKSNGAYLMIGQKPKEILNEEELKGSEWQSDEDIQAAAGYPTNLSRLTLDHFDIISRHGYELAKAVDLTKR